MRTYCFTCQDETILTQNGACSWCEEKIAAKNTRARYGVGCHSYIGTEEFYAAAYTKYLELHSIRKVAHAVWETAGYKTPESCANSLHEAWTARGWTLFRKAYSNTIHGKTRRGHKDAEHRYALRVKRGEIRGAKCAGTRQHYPRKGEPCSLYAQTDGAYCRHHDPARSEERHTHLARMRQTLEETR